MTRDFERCKSDALRSGARAVSGRLAGFAG